MDQFFISLTQIGIFIVLICVGIITVKVKLLDTHSLGSISRLVINISLPSYIFINAISSATRETLANSMVIIPIAIVVYIVLLFVSMLVEKLFNLRENRKMIFRVCLMFGNIGFLGIPLVSALYPQTAVLYVSVFTIVDQIIFWTYGASLTRPASQKRERASALSSFKNMLSPPLIAIILAIIFILAGIHLPEILSSSITALGNTSMPLALIYIGGVLCTSDIKSVLKCKEIYAGIVIKMVFLAVISYLAISAIGLPEDLAGTIAFIVALPGIESIAMLAKANGSDGDYAVGDIMIATIASLITLPIVSICIAL